MTPDQVRAIDAKLEQGERRMGRLDSRMGGLDTRMSELEKSLKANTDATLEMRDVLMVSKTGFRFVAWVLGIGAPLLVLYAEAKHWFGFGS